MLATRQGLSVRQRTAIAVSKRTMVVTSKRTMVVTSDDSNVNEEENQNSSCLLRPSKSAAAVVIICGHPRCTSCPDSIATPFTSISIPRGSSCQTYSILSGFSFTSTQLLYGFDVVRGLTK